MYNVSLIKFKCIKDKYGILTPIEENIDIPFKMKRIYYITEVGKEVMRGFHSHKKLHQVLVCINGSVKIKTKNPNEEEIIELNNSSVGLYIGPHVWREMFDFSPGCVLLVIASDYYNQDDYIRNYDFYLEDVAKIYN